MNLSIEQLNLADASVYETEGGRYDCFGHDATFQGAYPLNRMRILLTHHFPLEQGPVGQYVADLAQALQANEHEVRVIAIGGRQVREGLTVRTLACSTANSRSALPFDVPWFGVEPEGDLTFERLTAEQFNTYRDVLRHELDAEVASFDPQIIHAQYVWLWGQLALETGVPYVLTAWSPEFVSRARDDRYRPLADQAAENAGRIFVPDEHVRREVLDSFDDVALRTVLLANKVDSGLVAALVNHYLAVLDERFGT